MPNPPTGNPLSEGERVTLRDFLWWLDYQRLRFKWWWNYTRAFRDVKIKWGQDGSEGMSEEAFGRWIDGLTIREFLALMLQDDRRPENEDEADDDTDDEDGAALSPLGERK